MPAIWKSTHPDVLAWWDDCTERNKRYARECNKVHKKTGRNVVLRTGFGDERPMGLSKHSYNEDPPLGWKLGWGKRDSQFFEPRMSGRSPEEKRACEEAQALIAKLVALHVPVRSEAEDRFGIPDCQFFGVQVISPGYWLHDGVLWVTFGHHDFEPDKDSKMLQYFSPVKRSEYYAVREAAGIEGDD